MKVTYGVSAEEIAQRCGVDVTTARRWKRGATQIPKSAEMVLTGDLGCFDPDWKGWRIRRGALISPEGWEARAGDVLSIPLLRAQLSGHQARERELRSMEDQPLPGTVPATVKSA